MSKPIKLNDKIVKDHISDWTYETKDDQGNKVIKQNYESNNIKKREWRDTSGTKPILILSLAFNGRTFCSLSLVYPWIDCGDNVG